MVPGRRDGRRGPAPEAIGNLKDLRVGGVRGCSAAGPSSSTSSAARLVCFVSKFQATPRALMLAAKHKRSRGPLPMRCPTFSVTSVGAAVAPSVVAERSVVDVARPAVGAAGAADVASKTGSVVSTAAASVRMAFGPSTRPASQEGLLVRTGGPGPFALGMERGRHAPKCTNP